MTESEVCSLVSARPENIIWDAIRGRLYDALPQHLAYGPRIYMEDHLWRPMWSMFNGGISDQLAGRMKEVEVHDDDHDA